MSRRPPRGFVRRSAHVVRTSTHQTVRHAVVRRDPERRAESHREAARAAAGLLGTLKGGAMKLGQLASFVQLDFVPEPYRELWQSELAVLREAAPPVDFAIVREVLEQAWGRPPEDVLGELDPLPAAAASIGQVHRGRTRDGREVAVKVQYPDIARAVATDVGTAAVLLRAARAYAPNLDTRSLAAELRERVLEELDYESEASHQRVFARAYRDHPFIHVPDVLLDLSGPTVLVSEWVDGTGFDDVRKLSQSDRDRYGEILSRFFFGSIELLGLCHADPHPGNHRLRSDGRVAFLDFGAVREVDRARWERGHELALAAVRGDGEGVRDGLVDLGYVSDPDKLHPRQLLAAARMSLSYLMADEPVRIDATYVRDNLGASLAAAEEVSSLRNQSFPPEELWVVRMQVSLIAVLAQLEATANWQRIARETWENGPPATPLGEAHARWLEATGRVQ